MADGLEHFVYYRVRRADDARAESAVMAMQAELAARWPGLQGRLLRRVDGGPATGDVTLMEIYAGLPSPEAAAELESLAFARLAPWLVGERHVEAFVPCA